MSKPRYVAVTYEGSAGAVKHAVAEQDSYTFRPVAWANTPATAAKLAALASEGQEARDKRLRERQAAERRKGKR